MIRTGKALARRIIVSLYCLFASCFIPFFFRKAFRSGELTYLSKSDYCIWKNAMLKMLRFNGFHGGRPGMQVVMTFLKARIEVIRQSAPPDIRIPIVVLCVKNDLRRLRMLTDHYRGLGIERFAILDNGSEDGTFEWCLEQADMDLYRCTESYRTLVKEGWINRIVSCYGFNRWYILTDSDELLVYSGMETHPLPDLVHYAEAHHISRIRALVLDAYPDHPLFEKTDDIKASFRWIDTDSYREHLFFNGSIPLKGMVGGPRFRLMGSDVSLSKFPLIFFEPGTVSETAHYQFPSGCVKSSPYQVGILHYKFMDGDLDEYRARAEEKRGFAHHGGNYKKYLEYIRDHENITFMYEGSHEFTDSGVLDRISVLDPIRL